MDWLLDYFRFKKQVKKELPSALHFLNKRPLPKTVKIKLEEEGKTTLLTKEEFEQKFEIELLQGLYFNHLKELEKIVQNCIQAWKIANITALERWLGAYLEEELESGAFGPVYLKWTSPYKGYGLFADRDLPADTYIGEYAGLVRKHKKRLDEANAYCFEYPVYFNGKTPFTIDAKEEGNLLRFINHSEKPNLRLKPVYGQGIMHIILRTKEAVAKGTELTYDYGPTYWKKRPKPIS